MRSSSVTAQRVPRQGSTTGSSPRRCTRSALLTPGLAGHPLYSVVAAYLRSHIGPRLVDSVDGLSTSAVFNAAASMLELAGWMAHDRGEDRTAHVHFRRALEFTTLGDDSHLCAHVLGSMSHLAAHDGRPHETIQLARQGQDVLRTRAPHPPLTARLLALEARGVAGLGERTRPLNLLAHAEAELAKGGPSEQPPSPWVNHYDQASLASDTGRCLYRLGDLAGTRRQAEHIIALRPPQRARSHGLGQLTLAKVFVAQGALDEASAVVEQALSPSLPVHSAPIAQGLRTLHDTLRPHRSNAAVAQIHTRLTATLQRGGDLPGHRRPACTGTGT